MREARGNREGRGSYKARRREQAHSVELMILTFVHRSKTHVLDAKLKGESTLVVSASAISKVMKKHLSTYLVFVNGKVYRCLVNILEVLQ